MATTKEVFESAIRPLPPKERLQLAALILNDLTRPRGRVVEFGDSWSGEDIRDLTKFFIAEAPEG